MHAFCKQTRHAPRRCVPHSKRPCQRASPAAGLAQGRARCALRCTEHHARLARRHMERYGAPVARALTACQPLRARRAYDGRVGVRSSCPAASAPAAARAARHGLAAPRWCSGHVGAAPLDSHAARTAAREPHARRTRVVPAAAKLAAAAADVAALQTQFGVGDAVCVMEGVAGMTRVLLTHPNGRRVPRAHHLHALLQGC